MRALSVCASSAHVTSDIAVFASACDIVSVRAWCTARSVFAQVPLQEVVYFAGLAIVSVDSAGQTLTLAQRANRVGSCTVLPVARRTLRQTASLQRVVEVASLANRTLILAGPKTLQTGWSTLAAHSQSCVAVRVGVGCVAVTDTVSVLQKKR